MVLGEGKFPANCAKRHEEKCETAMRIEFCSQRTAYHRMIVGLEISGILLVLRAREFAEPNGFLIMS